MEMTEVSKRKAQILEDQNILMLFTTPETGIVSEEAKEYVHLKRTIELKKLRRQVAKEEELKKQYIASQEQWHQVELGESRNHNAQGDQQRQHDQKPISRSGYEDVDVIDQPTSDQVQRQENSEGGHFTDFHNEHEEEEGPEVDDFSQDPNDGASAARWWDTNVDVDVSPTRGHGGRRHSHGRGQWTIVGSPGD
jgi:hypothetical protein